MFNFKLIKKILILVTAIPSVLLFIFFVTQFKTNLKIKNFEIVSAFDVSPSRNSEIDVANNVASTQSNISFQYKLIGYRSGGSDASVIVKKSNKEFVVSIGQKLEGVFELIEVNQNEVIFKDGNKLYKIENLVGK
jgi:urease gamma subunit|tara:strand:- start:211 stop:615 length:405 start_codon:yes stop_codon:yes gene_type:complete